MCLSPKGLGLAVEVEDTAELGYVTRPGGQTSETQTWLVTVSILLLLIEMAMAPIHCPGMKNNLLDRVYYYLAPGTLGTWGQNRVFGSHRAISVIIIC